MSAQTDDKRVADDRPERLSPADAIARGLGVALLIAIGYAHLLDISHKVDEGIWYMVLAFAALIAAAIGIAVALVRAPTSEVRLAWLGAGLLSAGALLGYAVSRILPLPQMADHQGDWLSTYGVIAVLAEVGLIALAAYAMRDLTLRGVPHQPRSWQALTGVLSLTGAIAVALAANPAAALGHGGEDDEAESAADARGSGGTGEAGDGEAAAGAPSESAAPGGGGHGDPFLGTAELGLALLACLGFLVWAVRDLAARVDLPASRA